MRKWTLGMLVGVAACGGKVDPCDVTDPPPCSFGQGQRLSQSEVKRVCECTGFGAKLGVQMHVNPAEACPILAQHGFAEICDGGGVVFSLEDVKAMGVAVVSAFPARLGGDGNFVRTCDGGADSLELDYEVMTTLSDSPPCNRDNDLSAQPGDLIETVNVKPDGPDPTVTAEQFSVTLACGDEGTACPSGLADVHTANSVTFAKAAARCSPMDPSTWHDVALLVDHSGSTNGFVDADTDLEGPPDTLKVGKFGDVKSDPYNNRTVAAKAVLDTLSEHDRSVVFGFDESGVFAACALGYVCTGGPSKFEGKPCKPGTADACGGDPDACVLDLAAEDFGSAQDCFGSGKGVRMRQAGGIDLRATFMGEGRSPTWLAIDTAAAFLANDKTTAAKQILLITDGPDTCEKADPPCKGGDIAFATLGQHLAALPKPVHVHVVQFQAEGYLQPEPKLMDVACRTGGTYQFIESHQFNRSDANAFRAIDRAASKARNAFAGTWRLGLPLQKPLPAGQIVSLAGELHWTAPLFPTVASSFLSTDAWKFGGTRSLLLHVP